MIGLLTLDDRTRRYLARGIVLVQEEARRNGLMRIPELEVLYDALTEEDSRGPEATDVGDLDAQADDVFMSREAAARLLGISERHLSRLVKAGDVPSVELGRRRLFRRSELEEL